MLCVFVLFWLVVVFGTGVALFGVLCGFCRRVACVWGMIGGMDKEKISLDIVNSQDGRDVPDVAAVEVVDYGDGE